MKFLLDTAIYQDIKELISLSFVGGVTTNPSLLSKINFNNYKKDLFKIRDLCMSHNKNLSIEVFSNNPDEIYSEAIKIYNEFKFNDLYIKIPITYSNASVIQKLEEENIKINCTCVYTIEQAMPLALMNTSIISIFYNRTKDKGNNPNEIIKNLKKFISDNHSTSKIIAGSIRKINDVSESLLSGTDFVTLNPEIIKKCFYNEGSEESIDQFMSDLKSWQTL